ncbi:MAG: cation transporting ATPase C-terminal domain-containing protein [Sellimonas intestinalis]
MFINLLTDSLPAIALGLEPHRKDVMDEKPRQKDESILTRDFLAKIVTEGLSIGVMTMIAFMIGYTSEGALLRKYDGVWNTSVHPDFSMDITVRQTGRCCLRKGFFNQYLYLQGAFLIRVCSDYRSIDAIPALHGIFDVLL